MRSYFVKENHIGPAVSKNLWYRQTDRDILLLFYKDMIFYSVKVGGIPNLIMAILKNW